MISYKANLKSERLSIWRINEAGEGLIIKKDLIEIKMDAKTAQKVFGVNLTGREYSIIMYENIVEISFHDPHVVFGWLERISIFEFIKRTKCTIDTKKDK